MPPSTEFSRDAGVRPPPFNTVVLVLAIVVSSCASLGTNGGVDENRPERFRFEMRTPDDADMEIATQLLIETRALSDDVLIAESVEVEAVAPETPTRYFVQFLQTSRELGRMTCFGEVTERISNSSCSPIGDPVGHPESGIVQRGGGHSEAWSEATLQIRDEVDRLVAIAADGTRYVMIPAGGVAWIEWRSAHGDLLVEAFDAAGGVIATESIVALGSRR